MPYRPGFESLVNGKKENFRLWDGSFNAMLKMKAPKLVETATGEAISGS
jgi:hypothetical protein